MIEIGGVFRGPELEGSPIFRMVGALSRTINELRGEASEHKAPWVNSVFIVAGSFGSAGFRHLEYGKFSAAEKGIVVQIPVPADVGAGSDPGPFLIEMLHGANAMAFHFFDERGLSFPLREAEALVQAAANKLGIVDPAQKGAP